MYSLDCSNHDSDSVSPPEGLHMMAAIMSRPTSTGACRCLQLEDNRKTNVKCAYSDTEDHNRTTLGAFGSVYSW